MSLIHNRPYGKLRVDLFWMFGQGPLGALGFLCNVVVPVHQTLSALKVATRTANCSRNNCSRIHRMKVQLKGGPPAVFSSVKPLLKSVKHDV